MSDGMLGRLFRGRLVRAALIGALLAAGCGRRTPEPTGAGGDWYELRRELYFGIPVTLKFAPADEALAARAWAYLESVDAVFNDFKETSELSRVNASAGRGAVRVSPDLAGAVRLSVEVNRLTDGAFDPTVAPVRNLWRSAAKTGRPPADEEIASALTLCGMDKARLEGDSLSLASAGTRLDFGGIAKGMAVDRVVAMLKAAQVRAALVQIGGETAAFGVSTRGMPHVIGVTDPMDTSRIFTRVRDPGAGISAATSGNYYSPVVIGGEKYYHIFDPRTGRPISTRTLSVTIVFPRTGMNGMADGLSTAGAVLGHEKAIPMVERLGGQALFVVMEGEVLRQFKTSGWDALVPPESE